jgi:hypothetical protein
MHVCMRLMEVQKEISTTKNPWSFQQGYFLTNSTGALDRNGIAEGLHGREMSSFIYIM